MAEASFSRSSTAYGLDGTLVQVNQPRYASGVFGQGIFIEEGTTNLSPYITNFTAQDWGGGSGHTVTSGTNELGFAYIDFIPGTLSSTNLLFQSPTITLPNTAGQSYTLSVDYYSDNGNIPAFSLRSTDSLYYGTYNLNNVIDIGYGWKRGNYVFNIPSSYAGVNTFNILLRVANVKFSRVQLEQKNYATSYIVSTRQPETLTIPTVNILNAKVGTIEFWLKMDNWVTYPYFMFAGGGWTDVNTFAFQTEASGQMWFTYGGITLNSVGFKATKGQWFHIAASWNNKSIKFYINGSLKNSGTSTNIPNIINTMSIDYSLTNGLIGTIDDLRISNIARSDADIFNDYNSNQSLPIDRFTTCKMNFDGSLTYNSYLMDTVIANKPKYLKLFDKDHNILDEIEEYSGLKYTWTLNGTGKAQFNIGLESIKCTRENFEFRNHIEIWDSDLNICIWGGQIVDRNFAGSKLQVGCYGYLSLLMWRRLRAKTYPQMTYGNLLNTMLSDINSVSPTGVTTGNIASGSLLTQRIVENKDYLLDKMQTFIQDCNNDIDVDVNRKLNFYLRKGTNKSYYSLEYGGDADNILVDPSLSQTINDMANSIYSESTDTGTTLIATTQNNVSIAEYGLMEGSYSANTGIIIQSTLDNYTQGELQRRSYPANSISLKVKDSSLCPFSDIQVGDTVTVKLMPYWNFEDKLRIIEMTHDEQTGERDIVVGQTLYRPQPPVKKIYGK